MWLYHRFLLSVREIEEMMMVHGVLVTYETIHQWCRKFGQTFANQLRRRRPRPDDKWHLDEVFIKINGKTYYLWRAVDQDGVMRDILITSHRDAKARHQVLSQAAEGVAVRATDFLMAVKERTRGCGVSIFIDNLGVHPTTTLKAIGRQGVITTSGWKHRTVFPIARAIECQNRRIHVFTHYAKYEEGLAAVAFAEAHRWAPRRQIEVYSWEDVPRLADDYTTGRVRSYFPIFEMDPLGSPL